MVALLATTLSAQSSDEATARQLLETGRAALAAGKGADAAVAFDTVVTKYPTTSLADDALLERARIMVADETGWKLSTTRSAAAVAALLDVVSTRAETVALLDLMKAAIENEINVGENKRKQFAPDY